MVRLSLFYMCKNPYTKSVCLVFTPAHARSHPATHVCSADAIGDLFFDMLEVLPYPIACPNGTNTSHNSKYGPNPCTNPEAGGPELMVNKLTLEVDTRFSGCT